MGRSATRLTLLIYVLTALAFMYKEHRAGPTPVKALKRQAIRSQDAAPNIAYTVSMSKPWTHLLEVEMRIRWTRMPQKLELKMPVWTPGSYLIREYARHVQDFEANNGAGRPLAWRKTNKNTWQIDPVGSNEVIARYSVYANELTVRTNELNDEHAFWNNTALLMFPAGQLKAPSTVTVRPFGKWRVATGLPKVTGQPNTFRAADYDVLYDSPFEVSDFKEVTFNVRGKPHRVVVDGEGNYDLNKLAADLTKIVEETYKIFGELPYEDYLFIVNLRGGGGLEHLNSTALQFDRFGFRSDSGYKPERVAGAQLTIPRQPRYSDLLGLAAHEFFHAFNVKRIRPDTLGPFDYENENYTKLLWVAEGGTEYYSNLLLRRAGLISDKEFLETFAELIRQLHLQPGRFETSLEEASFDAWIKYYRQDENAVNNQISYYDKGAIVNFLLDISIRAASQGKRSLDDVMRTLYINFYKKGRNFTPQDVQQAAEAAAGRSLEDFFSKYVRGEAEIDYNPIIDDLGLRLDAVESNADRAYIGADWIEDGGRLTIRNVRIGTPAYDQGLNSGDQLIAIDGYRATQPRLQQYVGDRKPGDKVRLTVFRHDRLRDIEITLGNNKRMDFNFMPLARPSELQRRLYREYLNDEL